MDDYGQHTDKCPNCWEQISTPAEAAAHVCATAGTPDPTQQQVTDARIATAVKAAQRATIQPTPEKLRADAKAMVQAIVDGWDREVECIVILVPKGTLDNMAVSRFLVGEHRERQRQIFNRALSKASNLRRMNGS